MAYFGFGKLGQEITWSSRRRPCFVAFYLCAFSCKTIHMECFIACSFPCKSSSLSYRRFGTKTHFEKEDQDNSKLYNAILHVLMLGCKNWRIYLITLPWLRCYGFLYNEINARALIGQSAVGYCASKSMEKSREEDFVKKCGS